ncbi:META domain-containing protein [Confluentibacter citreus]|uniref:META domain-containing protein n=1 Tax=Confluentibacter citreus TaxID=2007307 RepID=UPI000C292212|nr:META domain-containing protein [Confluentibacter citreus]
MKIIIILSVLISLNTCCNSKNMAIKETNLMTLNGTYQVKTLDNKEVSVNNITINFNKEENIISGFSGCNRFSGTYSLENGLLKVGPLASTKMFCQDTHQIESEMQQVLSKANEILIEEDGILKLLSDKKIILMASKEQDNKLVSFNYSAMSRGRFLDINVNDSLVSISKDREAKPISKAINKESWKKLNTLLEAIALDSISNLKSPTEARFYDGASIGTLKISKNGIVYESSNFDHGTPPLEIEALVKEILSLSENVE